MYIDMLHVSWDTRILTGYEPFYCLAIGSAAELFSKLAGGGSRNSFPPTSALHPTERPKKNERLKSDIELASEQQQ
jgi:hypothetical protein